MVGVILDCKVMEHFMKSVLGYLLIFTDHISNFRNQKQNTIPGKIEAPKNDLQNVASHVVAYHFCQIDNSVTCKVPEWVHSLASQLSQSPCLKAYHQLLSMDHDLRTKL